LPVIDESGAVTGMLSRIDILRAIAIGKLSEAREEIPADGFYARYVEELRDRDEFSLRDELAHKAVVDAEGRLVGVITDRILMRALGGQIRGLSFGIGRRARLAARPIAGIMERDLKVATEKMTVYEALEAMTQYGLKRMPVVDAKGAYKGMIGRDSIMLAFAKLWDSSTEGLMPPTDPGC